MTVRVPTYTAEQVRSAERPLLDAGVPLMARAASALADIARSELRALDAAATAAQRTLEPVAQQSPDAVPPRVLVLAGSGDNGGDALYAAAQLTDVADVDALLVSDRFHQIALSAALGAGVRRIERPEAADAQAHYALVLDGILGIGASRDATLRGTAREVVAELLSRRGDGAQPRILAVDLPSGLHPDTGHADDTVLPADVTVTFGAVKAGLVTGRGPELAGEVVLVDLGLGPQLAAQEPAGEASLARIVTAPQTDGYDA
jgi:hydroxyethylthiazole kinase-like uncharacterized protein yjeF